MTPKYKYIPKLFGYGLVYCALAALFVACGGNQAPMDLDDDLIVTREQITPRNNKENLLSREVRIQNTTNKDFAKQILAQFPVEQWQYKSFKTLVPKLMKELVQKEMAVPFTLSGTEHILTINEMYQQVDDEEKVPQATFAVFSVDNKSAYVYVSEALIGRNNKDQILPEYQNFWHFDGKKWRSINNEVRLPDMTQLASMDNLAGFINKQAEMQYILIPSTIDKGKIVCYLPAGLVSRLKIDKSFNLKWVGNGFELEEEPEFVLSN